MIVTNNSIQSKETFSCNWLLVIESDLSLFGFREPSDSDLNVRFVVHNSKKKSVSTFIKMLTAERQRSVNMEIQSLIKIGWEANR